MLKRLLKNNIVIRAIERINSVLSIQQKKEAIVILFLLTLNVATDILGLGVIYPLMEMAINPDLIKENELYSYFYEMIGVANELSFLLVVSIVVLLILILKNIISFFIFYFQSDYCNKVAFSLNKKLLYYYYQQGYLFIKNESTGDKIYNINGMPQYFAEAYMGQLLLILTELLVTCLIILILLVYHPILFALLFIAVGPAYLLLFQIFKHKLEKIGQLTHQLRVKIESLLLETIDAFVDITLVNKEHQFLNELLQQKKTLFHQNLLVNIYNLIPRRIYDVILILGVLLVIFSHWMADTPTKVTSTLNLFAIAAYRLIPSISRIVASMMLMETLHPQIAPIMVLKGKELSHFPEVPRFLLKKGIRFNAISFTYPDVKAVPVLSKVSLYVKKGETVGFIGESGSGKTTLLNILLRLIIENSGVIEVDDEPLTRELNPSFQKSIGYVPQEVHIKEGTLRENIAFGETGEEICEDRIQNAVEGALLQQFVHKHSDGLEMKLGEKGVKLSGGQKQRVSIARALYRQTQILVFDEPTSALDPETERSIIGTINTLSATDITIFIVAHRITTLSSCDRIYELQNSKINRVLSYQELVSEQLVSANLVRL